jgi:hypothetical protein
MEYNASNLGVAGSVHRIGCREERWGWAMDLDETINSDETIKMMWMEDQVVSAFQALGIQVSKETFPSSEEFDKLPKLYYGPTRERIPLNKSYPMRSKSIANRL